MNLKRILLFPALTAAMAFLSVTHLPAQNDPATRDFVYLVLFKPGPAWIKGKPVYEQNLLEHGRYLIDQHEKGILLQAGPFTDDTGGAILYRANHLKDVEEWVSKDPAVVSEILVPTIYPWKWVEWDYHLERRKK